MEVALQQAAAESDPDSWNTSDDDHEDSDVPAATQPLAENGRAAANAEASDSGELVDARSTGEQELNKGTTSRAGPSLEGNASVEDEQQIGTLETNDTVPDNKAASFARAFAKIIESGESGSGLLQGSKSLSKRKREVDAEEQGEREARQLRREMRMRGHVKVPVKGKDPAMDAREKAFSRLATRGVVRLFNAVAKAQKQQQEAQEGGARAKGAAQLSKAAFLAELQGKLRPPQDSEHLVPSAPSRQKAGVGAAAAAPAAPASGGWNVLQGGLVGSAGSGMRMKDWDKTLEDSGDESGGGGDESESDAGDSSGLGE